VKKLAKSKPFGTGAHRTLTTEQASIQGVPHDGRLERVTSPDKKTGKVSVYDIPHVLYIAAVCDRNTAAFQAESPPGTTATSSLSHIWDSINVTP
jgi:hypothetical protein